MNSHERAAGRTGIRARQRNIRELRNNRFVPVTAFFRIPGPRNYTSDFPIPVRSMNGDKSAIWPKLFPSSGRSPRLVENSDRPNREATQRCGRRRNSLDARRYAEITSGRPTRLKIIYGPGVPIQTAATGERLICEERVVVALLAESTLNPLLYDLPFVAEAAEQCSRLSESRLLGIWRVLLSRV